MSIRSDRMIMALPDRQFRLRDIERYLLPDYNSNSAIKVLRALNDAGVVARLELGLYRITPVGRERRARLLAAETTCE